MDLVLNTPLRYGVMTYMSWVDLQYCDDVPDTIWQRYYEYFDVGRYFVWECNRFPENNDVIKSYTYKRKVLEYIDDMKYNCISKS